MGVKRLLAVVCILCAAWMPCAVLAENAVDHLTLTPKANWPVSNSSMQPTQGMPGFLMAQTDQPSHQTAPVEPAAVEEPEAVKPLEITVKGDWVSKYMFRGFDILDDRGAWQPSVDVGLWDSGLHLNVWSSFASSSRNDPHAVYGEGKPKDLDEFDYTVYYTKECLDGFIATEVGMVYYDIFRQDSENLDFWEAYGKLTLAKLPLAPHAYFYYDFPYESSVGGEGWMTCLGGSHTCELGAMPMFGTCDPLSLTLTGDVWYNGGAFVNGVETGWSHAVFGGTFAIPLPCNMTFSPGVFYQVSMEDTVNPDDEWWTQLSVAYTW